jgi:Family of unknown function (DUF5677)
MGTEVALNALENEIEPLERLILLFSATLDPPQLREVAEGGRVWRYDRPDVRHFCLLKAARLVSTLNASIALARNGYTQEICVLMRTLAECATHIEYVLEPYSSEVHRLEAQNYVEAYFSDCERSPIMAVQKAHIQQGKVHAALGKSLDDFAEQIGKTEGRTSASVLYINSYRILSNYVHAKYPESIDLFGGRPGQFHLRGMTGTPKEGENLAIIQSFLQTASVALVRMVQGLDLRKFVDEDPTIGRWYREHIDECEPHQQ